MLPRAVTEQATSSTRGKLSFMGTAMEKGLVPSMFSTPSVGAIEGLDAHTRSATIRLNG